MALLMKRNFTSIQLEVGGTFWLNHVKQLMLLLDTSIQFLVLLL
jgi:hypothetical protein